MAEFERREFHNVLNNSVLESDKFPMIKFVSVSVSDARKSGETRSFTLNGDLTMRDVTKRVSFPSLSRSRKTSFARPATPN